MKIQLSSLALFSLLLTSPLAYSQQPATEFDYISGGFQYTVLSDEFTSSHYFYNDKEKTSVADSMAGAYLKGSWNFTHRLYVAGKVELSKRNQFSLSHHNVGIGFYQPVSQAVSLFTTLGIANLELKQGEVFDHKKQKYSESGASVEVGLRYTPFDIWLVEPSFRTDQFEHTFNEYRLGNVFNVSNNMKIEANFSYSTIDKFSTTNYQLGVRYTF
ncbi:autotransporter outer membrane beta-barrel domain-containing protein [Photobacterium sp. BZF1]|uniref:autotransporter outer membrane beta-barrel domain-containing protein n=1 Tax=Photobacterium sp. BZF1 TaxID=1904457 RepID=UPI0016536BB3|nr:autotransporter outer membrane beta-barrel domain-containing protein [Photobacterium sp. BZF1]MBC7006479.1 autotransporter outer membrane beta-barrel domain-containing protein [Photobacterium sp. BZF1]